MARWAWMLAFLVAVCGVAHAKPYLDRWDAVQALPAGAEINVLADDSAVPDLCHVSKVAADTLTCLAEDARADVRLVYPRSAVREVWVFGPAHGWNTWTWIKAGLVAAVVGLAAFCVVANPLCLLLFGAGAMAILSQSPFPTPPPRSPRWRRHLLYRAFLP